MKFTCNSQNRLESLQCVFAWIYSSSLISFDLYFRALNWYSSITFTLALLLGSMCTSRSPILIRTVSWVVPDLSFFAWCKMCRAVCWRYSQSDSLPVSASASVVFLTFSFDDSLLFSCLLSDHVVYSCSLRYFLPVLVILYWTCILHAVCFYSVRSGCWVSWSVS